jgi:hypothetical protein
MFGFPKGLAELRWLVQPGFSPTPSTELAQCVFGISFPLSVFQSIRTNRRAGRQAGGGGIGLGFVCVFSFSSHD